MFDGRSRVNRMNLAQDHVTDRRQALDQARKAREERERVQQRRKAAVVMVRAVRRYLATKQLQALAAAAVLESTSVVRAFSVASLLALSSVSSSPSVGAPIGGAPLPAHEDARVGRCVSLVVHLLELFGNAPRQEVEALSREPLAMCGVRRTLEAALRHRITSTRLWASSSVASNLALLVDMSPEYGDWLSFLVASVASLTVGMHVGLDEGNTARLNISSLLIRSLRHKQQTPSTGVLVELLAMPLSFPPAEVTMPSSSSAMPRNWENRALQRLMQRDNVIDLRALPSGGSDPGCALLAAEVADIVSSLSATEGQGWLLKHATPVRLQATFHRLVRLAGVVPVSSAEGFSSILMRLLDEMAALIATDTMACGMLLDAATNLEALYDLSGGLGLFGNVATSAVPPAVLDAVSLLLSTPHTMVQQLGDETDRYRAVPLLSRLVGSSNTLAQLQHAFVSGAAAGGGGSTGGGWLRSDVPPFAVRLVGCPSLFLHAYGYYVDSGLFTSQLAKEPGRIEEASRGVVRALRDVAVRAHLYGCADAPAEMVATRCCVLLSKLFAIDEVRGFAATSDWMGSTAFNPQSIAGIWQVALAADEEDDATESVSEGASVMQVAARRALIKHQLRKNYFSSSRKWDTGMRLVAMLRNIPFVVPFDTRARVFGTILHSAERNNSLDRPGPFRGEEFVVRRGSVFEDAFLHFGRGPLSVLRHRLSPRFRGPTGDEAGFGDGVYRDFIQSVCAEGFAPEHGLFCKTEDGGFLYPNPLSKEATQNEEHLLRFKFLGAIVGKALYDGILLDVPFSPHFRNALLGRRNTFDHLARFDPQLYRTLSEVRDMKDGTVDAYGLYFTATQDAYGDTREVPLVPNGAMKPVTSANVAQYVLHYADFRLNRENEAQTRAFQLGLHEMVESTALQIFGSNELDVLFQGSESATGLDVDDWEANTVYQPAEATKNEAVIGFFWMAVRGMSTEEQRSLLAFVTSSRRAPLLGFQHMVPKFTISVTASSPDFLPSAATCFCQLKIPRYRSLEETRQKLLQAVAHGKTFELS